MSNFFNTLGVDGCPAGWVSVHLKNHNEWCIELFTSIQELWDVHHHSTLILIDIPIGLRDGETTPRLNDSAARKYLTRKRSSCIFPPPCRQALRAPSYEKANKINKNLTEKGLSKQAWNICSKIREVDDLLQNDQTARDVFIESGPELSYCLLNNNQPLKHYKKTKEGFEERFSILKSNCLSMTTPLDSRLTNYKRKQLCIDDIMDAWILAIRASRGKSNLHVIPDNIEHDSTGLPMRIAF